MKKHSILATTGGVILAMALIFILTSCGDGAGTHTHTWNTETGLCSGCSDLYYKIGDTGPGTGKIFFTKAAGFPVTGIGTCHYLEAAPADLPGVYVWAMADYHEIIIPGTLTGIGTGKNNTGIIIDELGNDARAAFACDVSTIGDKNDWFLPSKDELNELYENKGIVGLVSALYWSSSQKSGSYYAWCQYGNSGELNETCYSNNTNNVRAIRAF